MVTSFSFRGFIHPPRCRSDQALRQRHGNTSLGLLVFIEIRGGLRSLPLVSASNSANSSGLIRTAAVTGLFLNR
jgi:hypothetical protein